MVPVTRYAMLVALAAAVGACASSQTASINSNPEAASVAVNGQLIGTTPANHDFVFTEDVTHHRITGSKEGYHDATVVVSENSLKRAGGVTLTLESQNKSATITSRPSQASVKIGDDEIGRTPTEYTFNFANKNRRYSVWFSKAGYFDSVVTVTENSSQLSSGVIDAVLEDDPAWTTTSESEATNKWLRIPVDPAISHANAWQKVIDSVTSVYDSLEQLDQTSGYLRSTSRIKEFDKGPEGPFFVRTQFIGSISSADPLTYKIKLLSKRRLKSEPDESWKDFERVFSEDAQLVEELLGRLGLK